MDAQRFTAVKRRFRFNAQERIRRNTNVEDVLRLFVNDYNLWLTDNPNSFSTDQINDLFDMIEEMVQRPQRELDEPAKGGAKKKRKIRIRIKKPKEPIPFEPPYLSPLAQHQIAVVQAEDEAKRLEEAQQEQEGGKKRKMKIRIKKKKPKKKTKKTKKKTVKRKPRKKAIKGPLLTLQPAGQTMAQFQKETVKAEEATDIASRLAKQEAIRKLKEKEDADVLRQKELAILARLIRGEPTIKLPPLIQEPPKDEPTGEVKTEDVSKGEEVKAIKEQIKEFTDKKKQEIDILDESIKKAREDITNAGPKQKGPKTRILNNLVEEKNKLQSNIDEFTKKEEDKIKLIEFKPTKEPVIKQTPIGPVEEQNPLIDEIEEGITKLNIAIKDIQDELKNNPDDEVLLNLLKRNQFNKRQLEQDLGEEIFRGKYAFTGTGFRGRGIFSNEIDYIMEEYPKFLGAVPKDKILDLDLQPGIGFIMNLDDSSKEGSHWVGIYIDNDGSSLMYYDPFGDDPPDSFMKDLEEIAHRVSPTNYLKLKINRVKNQSVSSDNCGWLAMIFLKKMFNNKSFKDATGYKQQDNSKEFEKQAISFKNKFQYI